MKKTTLLFLVIFLILLCALPVSAENSWNNHWAAESMNRALENGWLEGNIDPESSVTLQRFVMMLQKANGITPDGTFARTLDQKSHISNTFTDTSGTDLQTSGYLQTALDFGILLPSDYSENKLTPLRNLTRSDAIVLTTRVFGGVYSARNNPFDRSRFSDIADTSEWLCRYINESAENNILKGYPDNTVKTEKDITLAEAVAMIDRTVLYTERGTDPDIKLNIVNYYPGVTNSDPPLEIKTKQAELHVPIQMIDNIVYVPAKSVYFTALELHDRLDSASLATNEWLPVPQIFQMSYGLTILYQAGQKQTAMDRLDNWPYGDITGGNEGLVSSARIESLAVMFI